MDGFWRHFACLVAAGPLLLSATFEARAAPDDVRICAKETGDAAIDACSRAIKSGRYRGRDLARQYLYRGAERRAKEDYDLALSDFGEAAKIDNKYADAFYNRCVIFNLRKEYDRAVTECSQAVKLGPSPNATAAVGGERLGNERTTSDYYSERGFAHLRKDDYVHAMVDLDNAVRLNSRNARALKIRAQVYEAKGDTARAEVDLAAAKQLGE